MLPVDDRERDPAGPVAVAFDQPGEALAPAPIQVLQALSGKVRSKPAHGHLLEWLEPAQRGFGPPAPEEWRIRGRREPDEDVDRLGPASERSSGERSDHFRTNSSGQPRWAADCRTAWPNRGKAPPSAIRLYPWANRKMKGSDQERALTPTAKKQNPEVHRQDRFTPQAPTRRRPVRSGRIGGIRRYLRGAGEDAATPGPGPSPRLQRCGATGRSRRTSRTAPRAKSSTRDGRPGVGPRHSRPPPQPCRAGRAAHRPKERVGGSPPGSRSPARAGARERPTAGSRTRKSGAPAAANLTRSRTGLRRMRPRSLRIVCAEPYAQRCCWLLKSFARAGNTAGTAKSVSNLKRQPAS